MVEFLDKVLDFALESEWNQFPPEVQTQAKLSILDNLGSLLAGTQTDVMRIVMEHVLEQYPGEEANILGTGMTATCTGATLANAFAGNALDIDDGHNLANGHAGATILPAIFAMAQLPGARKSGCDILAATVIGNEIALRAGIIRHALFPSYHPSGSWVPLGVAAAGGYLLNLGKDVTREAMGTSDYHATIGPMMECIKKPSMVKDGMGWGAMTGVSAVLLARKGFTGILPIFARAPDHLCLGLGSDFEFLKLNNKRFASCRWGHAAIEGAIDIYNQMKANNLALSDIQTITIKTFEASKQLYQEYPKNTEEAQYSMTYPVAAALIDGEMGPRQILPPRLFDQDVLNLATKIKVEFAKECEEVYPRIFQSEVIVQTRLGKEYKSGLVEPKWNKDVPASREELEGKFRWLTAPVLGQEKTEKLIEIIFHLEDLDNIQELIDLCCK